ncbi:MAG: hypothetical protein ABL859_01530 [Methylotenera sp.]|uniref:hypothetical protein n=1 Tax=Methylotenera sp. TaxID=2051956 RepID=UPI0017FC1C35|nr:hypothetical protein [Methylotenera sp.]NOU24604.1 hypothetical protein [Methylotenera sp.]
MQPQVAGVYRRCVQSTAGDGLGKLGQARKGKPLYGNRGIDRSQAFIVDLVDYVCHLF